MLLLLPWSCFNDCVEHLPYSYYGRQLQNVLPHRFHTGRVDCQTSPWTNDLWEFPSALGDNEHIVDFFNDQFGFDEKESAAILGRVTVLT